MTILSNEEIRKKSKTDGLIANIEPTGLCGASYELRCSAVYYDLTEDGTRIDAKKYNNTILIKPKHTVALIVEEKIKIPNNLTAHIISKGSLFSIGLSPVCTYADPGFDGKLGLVTTNNSEKYIILNVLQTIAKIHFSQLTSDSNISYKGQHGYHTEIWPIRTELQKEHKEILNDKRLKSEKDEAMFILPRHTAIALNRLTRENIIIMRCLAAAFLLNAIFFYLLSREKGIEIIASIAINLISSAITALISFRVGYSINNK